MTNICRATFAFLIAPLALALGGCGSESADDGAPPEGEPIAAIPAPQGEQWTSSVTVTDEGGHLLGNPEAPLKLVEYASLTCPACAHFSEEATAPLQEKYINSGVVSYELRNQVHNAIDLTLNVMVRCAPPEAYHPLSEQVWANLPDIMGRVQERGEALQAASDLPEDKRFIAIAETAELPDFFAQRGISTDQAEACLGDVSKAREIADRSEKQSEEMGVTGTPFFFLNGQSLGSMGWQQLEPILQKAGAR